MPKLTLEERRLQILRQQLSGKTVAKSYIVKKTVPKFDSEIINKATSEVLTSSIKLEDTSYLFYDLKKIAILSTLAISSQLIIYYSLQMNLIRLWN